MRQNNNDRAAPQTELRHKPHHGEIRENRVATHINENQPQYGDLTGLDFKQSMDLITEQTSKFMTLPAGIRAMFQNDPASTWTS